MKHLPVSITLLCLKMKLKWKEQAFCFQMSITYWYIYLRVTHFKRSHGCTPGCGYRKFGKGDTCQLYRYYLFYWEVFKDNIKFHRKGGGSSPLGPIPKSAHAIHDCNHEYNLFSRQQSGHAAQKTWYSSYFKRNQREDTFSDNSKISGGSRPSDKGGGGQIRGGRWSSRPWDKGGRSQEKDVSGPSGLSLVET